MNTVPEKKDENISFWARLFFMKINEQHSDYARISMDNKVVNKAIRDIVVEMFSDVFSSDIHGMSTNMFVEYPGDDIFINKNGPNKAAEWNAFKVIVFKRLCEMLGRVIGYNEFTIYYNIYMSGVAKDDVENNKSKWHTIIEILDIPLEYIPFEIKSVISKSAEEFSAIKIIDKHIKETDNVNGMTYTFESYLEYLNGIVKKMSDELNSLEMYGFANSDIASYHIFAVKIGMFSSSVLYSTTGNPSIPIPNDILKSLLSHLWEELIAGKPEQKGPILSIHPVFMSKVRPADDDSDQDDDDDGDETDDDKNQRESQ